MGLSEETKEKYRNMEVRFPATGSPAACGIIEDVDELGFTVRVTGTGIYEKGDRLYIPHSLHMIFKIMT